MAWGIAPSEDTILTTSVDLLERKLGEQIVSLSAHGIEREKIGQGSVISPACGLGSQTEQVAEDALGKLQELVRQDENLQPDRAERVRAPRIEDRALSASRDKTLGGRVLRG